MQKRQAPAVEHLGAAASDHYTDRDSSTGSNPSCDSDSSTRSDRLGSEDGAGRDTAGGDVAGGRSKEAANTRDPFTKSQQAALERTLRSLICKTKGMRKFPLSFSPIQQPASQAYINLVTPRTVLSIT